jgi:hypothetical protein
MRKKVMGKYSKMYMDSDPRLIPSAQTLWGEGVREASRELLELNFGLWGYNKFSCEFKKFLFNLVQGRLYLNNVLWRINGTRPICTFCEIIAKRELAERAILADDPRYEYYLNLQPVENVKHLFWDCQPVQDLIQKCFRWLTGKDWYRGVETIVYDHFFLGIENNSNKGLVRADLIWKHFVKFFVMNCRYRKKIPKFGELCADIEYMYSNLGHENLNNLQRVYLLYEN